MACGRRSAIYANWIRDVESQLPRRVALIDGDFYEPVGICIPECLTLWDFCEGRGLPDPRGANSQYGIGVQLAGTDAGHAVTEMIDINDFV